VYAFAQAGGVDELPDLAVHLDQAVDGVDRGAGYRVDYRAFLVGQAVEEAGLADIRAADQGYPAGAADGIFDDGRGGGHGGEDGV
jgi:hypothetical protein